MKQRILWFDAIGGLTVGVLVLGAAPWLSTFYGMPLWFVLFMGAANVAYGSYSGSLVLRRHRSRAQLRLLSTANGVWCGLCCVFIAWWWDALTVFGFLHLAAEGLYVAVLGVLERRWIGVLIRQR